MQCQIAELVIFFMNKESNLFSSFLEDVHDRRTCIPVLPYQLTKSSMMILEAYRKRNLIIAMLAYSFYSVGISSSISFSRIEGRTQKIIKTELHISL
jgi:hypothetical protein